MRRHDQLSLTRPPIDHPHAKQLDTIGEILSTNPRMALLVSQDLVRGVAKPHTGARGMSGEQVLRALIVKQMTGFSYEELAFHLADSGTYRAFCRFGALEPVPGRSTLAENIKRIRPKTLEKINRRLVRYAVGEGIETGRRVRFDATVTESNIHAPTDSSLLFDGVRVLTRLLGDAHALCGFAAWCNHTKRAKRRMLDVQNTRDAARREEAYTDLLTVTYMCVEYATAARSALRATKEPVRAKALVVAARLSEYLIWISCVIDQTERRVLEGESVPSEEKVVSIFETHTDIIVKDRRDTFYGHKVFVGAGSSGLITDCIIASGNPADTTMVVPLLRRQRRILGRVQDQAAFDGGFASKENLTAGKALGVTDLAFSKKRGLAVTDMTRSSWVYRSLRNFRAGIEGLISFLKRAMGMDRCTWKGKDSFASYVLASVLTGNLLTLARRKAA